MTTRLTLDHYVYEDIYPAFKEATDEKEITADLSRLFLNYLAERNLVLTGADPAIVADIGCGPCDTLIKYLRGVVFAPGYKVRATDYLAEYAHPERGEGLRLLQAAATDGAIKLADYALDAGDAFGGNILALLSRPHERAHLKSAFSLVYASHMLYHAESPSQVQGLLADIAGNLLAPGGICILFHIANRPTTFQDFRARFGSQASAASVSDTAAVTIDDPPGQIAAASSRLHLPLYEMEFETKLHFESLSNPQWQAFKNPQAYDGLADSHPTAYECLKRLYFIVQRAPIEFAADRSGTGLGVFIDEIRRVIESNSGVLYSLEQMQVFTRTDAPSILAEAIPLALSSAHGAS